MKKRGFTVVELVVAMSVSAIIVGSIVALLVFTQRYSQFRAADIPARDEMKNVETVIKDFFINLIKAVIPLRRLRQTKAKTKAPSPSARGELL